MRGTWGWGTDLIFPGPEVCAINLASGRLRTHVLVGLFKGIMLWSLGLSLQLYGPYSFATYKLVLSLTLGLYTMVLLFAGPLADSRRLMVFGSCALLAALMGDPSFLPLPVALYAMTVPEVLGGHPSGSRGYLMVAIAYGGKHLVPALGSAATSLSLCYCRLIQSLGFSVPSLAASASGFWLVLCELASVAWDVSTLPMAARLWAWFRSLLQAAGAWAAYIVALPLLPMLTTPATAHYAAQAIIPLVVGTAACLLPARATRRETRKPMGAVASSLLMIPVLLIPLTGSASQIEPGPSRVLLVGGRGTTWESPSYEHGLGTSQLSMFGGLVRLLDAQGWDVEVSSLDGLSKKAIDEADVVTIVNPDSELPTALKKALWEAVAAGRGIIVLGDHTDIFGTQKPLEDLLSPVGVRFRFDSAMPLRPDWRYCLDTSEHPIVSTLGRTPNLNLRCMYGVGASLDRLHSTLQPALIGKYAFSDQGNRLNAGAGAYLGNYSYDSQESLGDVCLVLTGQYGAGHVLIMGDTSPYQTVVIPWSWRFVNNTFDWAAGKPQACGSPSEAFVYVGFFLSVLGLVLPRLRSAAIAVGMACLVTVAPVAAASFPVAPIEHAVLIEATPPSIFSLTPYSEDGISGLAANVWRSGYVPLLCLDSTDHQALAWSEGAIVLSPLRRLPEAVCDGLLNLVGRGGWVMMTVGPMSASNVRPLLDAFGGEVGDVPLGPTLQSQDAPLRHHAAWEMTSTDPNVTVLSSLYGRSTAVRVDRSGGAFVAIADPELFLNKNLESEYSWEEANVEFLRQILNDIR